MDKLESLAKCKMYKFSCVLAAIISLVTECPKRNELCHRMGESKINVTTFSDLLKL